MKKTRTSNRMIVKTGLKAGGIRFNHNVLVVKTGVKAGDGGIRWNHNATQLVAANRS